MFDMADESQQSLHETHEEKMARWEKARRERREQLIQAGIATAEQLKELDEEFTPETVNFAIHCWKGNFKDYADLRHEVDCCACIY